MMKATFLFILILSFFCMPCRAQENWQLVHSFDVTGIDAWDIDPMGKIIYAKNDALTKLDTNFQVRFTQSVKSFGEISKIDARHSLKTLLFSEEQQAITFVDNTLTEHKGIKDLSLLNISYATNVSYSAQTNRYWVFDGDNTTLVLIDELKQRPQTLENLAGIIGAFEVTELIEMENVLILFDNSKGIYLFDIYGSLIDFIPILDAVALHFSENRIFYNTPNELISFDLRNRQTQRILLPEKGIDSFKVLGNYFYFKTGKQIKKYLLKNKD